ncbi:SCP2 sterol-binding domain-containing protein [Deltaproteobacteria bacterium OttesenSCG-928-K17]|nr:SCP2 sterol-binding domain-containing protein [Deltaproteobacteria bacterium OttesenSCG-928-K17]
MKINDLFSILKEKAGQASLPQDIEATVQVELSGADPADWNAQVRDGRVVLAEGRLETPDLTISAASETAVGLFEKRINPMAAFMTGKIKVKGDVGKAALLKNLLTGKK